MARNVSVRQAAHLMKLSGRSIGPAMHLLPSRRDTKSILFEIPKGACNEE